MIGNSFDFNFWWELSAMKYYNGNLDAVKAQPILENKDNEYMATQKWDGEWGMFIIDENGKCHIRGRNRNVKNEYEDKAPKLPHIVKELENTCPPCSVILGEICWNELGKVSTDVGSILRCLPAKAVERQKEHKLVVKVFDLLCWNKVSKILLPYVERFTSVVEYFPYDEEHYCKQTKWANNNFREFADEIIAAGGEGCVISRKDYPYEPGKRTAWKTLKLKEALPEKELQVIDTLNPNKDYNGIALDTWDYWLIEASEDGEEDEFVNINNEEERRAASARHPEHSMWVPVTKPYFMGWKAGVRVLYENNVCVDVTSGLHSEDAEWLASPEAQEAIKQGLVVATVKGMKKASQGGIRHPVLVKLEVKRREE